MNPPRKPLPSLAEIECEVVAEAANGVGTVYKTSYNDSPMNMARFFPLRQRKRRALSLRSELGKIELGVDYGQKLESRRWLIYLAEP